MGKNKLTTPKETEQKKDSPKKDSSSDSVSNKVEQKSSKKKLDSGILHVQSTYNNTKVLLSDSDGNAVLWSSAGALGFKGAKKGTPFAAAKVGETLALKASTMGLKEINVIVKGVGSGRESAIRGFISKGFIVKKISDETPVPHNGPKPKKPRRV